MTIVHTVDAIIRYQGGIVLIERGKAPFGWALPGGKVDYGIQESLEDAVEREVREETHLKLANLRQFRTYSAPDRDPRFRAISTVFTADGYGILRGDDDAKNAKVLRMDQLDTMQSELAFDHYRILSDYRSNPDFATRRGEMRDESGTYLVAYKRDARTERSKRYGSDRRLFDGFARFQGYGKAAAFRDTHQPATLIKELPVTDMDLGQAVSGKSPFAVVVEHYGKYRSWCMGESDPVTSYDVITCEKGRIEEIVRKESIHENFKKVWLGLEMRLMP